jgi:hypothetical protein
MQLDTGQTIGRSNTHARNGWLAFFVDTILPGKLGSGTFGNLSSSVGATAPGAPAPAWAAEEEAGGPTGGSPRGFINQDMFVIRQLGEGDTKTRTRQ